ncbi:uncharacterized protein PG986_011404 [Apiospora aurea]|uniref:Malate dehydrogenase n=1 Tax=Apiospora aurea TaxID=335848 RepID=A0ABR1Q4Z2_9PEZI
MLPQTLFVVASALTAVTAGPVRKRCSGSGGTPVISSSPLPGPSTAASATASASASASAPATAGPTLPSTGSQTIPTSTRPLTPWAPPIRRHPTPRPPRANSSTSSSATASRTTPAPRPTRQLPLPPAPSPCSTTSPTWPPGSGSGKSAMTEAAWSGLSDQVLHETDLPLHIVGNALTKYAADVLAPFKAPPGADAALTLDGLAAPRKAIGHHYFDASGVPTFDLFAGAQKLVAKKLNDTAAPAGADRGLLDTGAVAWLRLGDSGSGASRGLASVYRVYTSGGASIACSEANMTISVPYTAQYWFYA